MKLQIPTTEQDQEAEKGFEKSLKKVTKSSVLDILYLTPKFFIKMVGNKYRNGLILWGKTGLGKSYLVKNTFMEEKIPFIYHTGHITTLQLYQFIYKHKDENIVFDDIDLLSNEINLNILKSCLDDDIKGGRVVCYSTTSNKLKVPDRFIFNGTIILLMNEKPKSNANLSAVESRVINWELSMDYITKIKVMFELAGKPYKELNLDERIMIVNWIKYNTSQVTRNLNLRYLFYIFEMYRFDKKRWKGVAKQMLIEDEEMKLRIEEEKMITAGMGWKEWQEITGYGRATYFRWKKQLKLKNGNKKVGKSDTNDTNDTLDDTFKKPKNKVIKPSKPKIKKLVSKYHQNGISNIQENAQKHEGRKNKMAEDESETTETKEEETTEED